MRKEESLTVSSDPTNTRGKKHIQKAKAMRTPFKHNRPTAIISNNVSELLVGGVVEGVC